MTERDDVKGPRKTNALDAATAARLGAGKHKVSPAREMAAFDQLDPAIRTALQTAVFNFSAAALVRPTRGHLPPQHARQGRASPRDPEMDRPTPARHACVLLEALEQPDLFHRQSRRRDQASVQDVRGSVGRDRRDGSWWTPGGRPSQSLPGIRDSGLRRTETRHKRGLVCQAGLA